MKFPGRVGDSPLIGAGIYCSKKAGATCTGTGELTMRLSTARLVVDRIETNHSPERAAELGILDLQNLKEEGIIHILAMDNEGKAAGVTNAEGLFHYYAN